MTQTLTVHPLSTTINSASTSSRMSTLSCKEFFHNEYDLLMSELEEKALLDLMKQMCRHREQTQFHHSLIQMVDFLKTNDA